MGMDSMAHRRNIRRYFDFVDPNQDEVVDYDEILDFALEEGHRKGMFVQHTPVKRTTPAKKEMSTVKMTPAKKEMSTVKTTPAKKEMSTVKKEVRGRQQLTADRFEIET